MIPMITGSTIWHGPCIDTERRARRLSGTPGFGSNLVNRASQWCVAGSYRCQLGLETDLPDDDDIPHNPARVVLAGSLNSGALGRLAALTGVSDRPRT